MILLDVAKYLKDNKGYEEIATNDLITVLRDGFESIKEMAVSNGQDFSLQIPKFGTFKVMRRKARVGFNPQTKEKINIPEKYVFKLRPSSIMRTTLSELAIPKAKKKKKGDSKKKKK